MALRNGMANANGTVLSLTGQRALITGGSSGIARSICMAFARRRKPRPSSINSSPGDTAVTRRMSRAPRSGSRRISSSYVTGATLYVDGGMTLYPGFAEGG
jgi:NAD(P)-dependent dehydrogenase (short-subunit alcohol dehydrogenase family)